MTRTYTAKEIDDMRETLKVLWLPSGGKNDAMVEDRLRTYIAAGVEPGDLERQYASAARPFVRRT